MGYFGYDFAREAEHLPNCPDDVLGLPDVHLMRFDTLLVIDHSFNHLLLITHLDLSAGAEVSAAYAAAEAELKQQTPPALALGPQIGEVQDTPDLDSARTPTAKISVRG